MIVEISQATVLKSRTGGMPQRPFQNFGLNVGQPIMFELDALYCRPTRGSVEH